MAQAMSNYTVTQSIPEEILLEIFLALPRRAAGDSSQTVLPVPILLGSVCRRWREVANSAPRLWTTVAIHINQPSSLAGALQLFHLFATRSGVCALDVAIQFRAHRLGSKRYSMSSGHLEQCISLARALAALVERCKHLQIHCMPGFLRRIELALADRLPWSMPLLENLDIQEQFISAWPDIKCVAVGGKLRMFSRASNLRRVNLIDCIYLFDFLGGARSVQLPWQQIEQLDNGAFEDGNDFVLLLQECPNLIRWDDVSVYSVDPDLEPDLITCHSLQSLDIHFGSQDIMHQLFERLELPSLLDLRVDADCSWGNFQQGTTAVFTSFLAKWSNLQRLVLRLETCSIPPADLYTILKAVPGLLEFEYSHSTMHNQPTVYSKELLLGLAFPTTSCAPGCGCVVLLPKLRTLSLVGKIDLDLGDFTAMIRSRTREMMPGTAHHGTMLQSLHMYILKGSSISAEDLAEVKAILGDSAVIRTVASTPLRSPAFPDLL